MQKEKWNLALGKVLSFLAVPIDQNGDKHNAVPTTRVHSHYSKIVADVTKKWASRH